MASARSLDKISTFTRSRLNRLILIGLVFIGVGTVVFHIVEDFSWVDSLYFSVVTLATVGYGDLTPQTTLGKLFAIFYIILGVVLFVALARAVLIRITDRRKK